MNSMNQHTNFGLTLEPGALTLDALRAAWQAHDAITLAPQA